MIKKIVGYSPEGWTIDKLMYQYKIEKIKINPEFQRKYVWNETSLKDKLMESIFLGYPIGVFTFWSFKSQDEVEEKINVVDGLQRITTIMFFINSDKKYMKIGKDVSKSIIEAHMEGLLCDKKLGDKNAIKIISDYNRGVTSLLTYSKLSEGLKNAFTSYQISVNTISSANKNQIMQYFSVVQNQEKLKAGELINAIPDNEIIKILREMNFERALKEMFFNNDRNDFVKFLIMYHGMINSTLKFGEADKHIIKYAEKMKSDKIFNLMLENFIILLNGVKFNKIYQDRSFNKFAMKLLLGIIFMNNEYIDSQEKLQATIQKLYYLSDQLSKGNSIKRKNEVKQSWREKIDQIILISKTSHKTEIIKEKINVVISILDEMDENIVSKYYKKILKKSPSKDKSIKVFGDDWRKDN